VHLTTLSGTAAALLLHPEVTVAAGRGEADRLRDVALPALPAQAAGWLELPAVDGEQVRCLTDLVRSRVRDDPAFREVLAGAVEAFGGVAAEALHRLAASLRRDGHWDTATWCYRRCEAVLVALGDRRALARCMVNLGALYEDLGRTVEAAECYARGQESFAAVGDGVAAELARVDLGRVRQQEGRYDEALELIDAAVTRLRAAGDEVGAVRALVNRANVVQDQGRGGDALAQLDWCRGALHVLGDREGVAYVEHNLAAVRAEMAGPADQACASF